MPPKPTRPPRPTMPQMTESTMNTPGTDPIVELHDVRFSYDGETEILRGVSAVFDAGKAYAIVGASGIGKSTLNNIENGKVSPTLFQLETIAIALGVKITDLFESEYK